MQFIQEVPPIVQVIDAAALVLVVALIVLSRRRRRGLTAATMSAAATPGAAKSTRSKGEKGIPRRKRRKLAAEAAQSMGVDAEVAAAVDRIVVPPVEIAPPAAAPVAADDVAAPVAEVLEVAEVADVAEIAEVAEAAPVAHAAQVAVADDPYVSDDFEHDDAADGVVVADPGWPTPGELASGFDPDAFDPLPEVRDEPEAFEEYDEYDAYDEDLDTETPTGVIEIPVVADAEVEALGLDDAEAQADDGQDWADGFDPATGWADPADDGDGVADAPEPDWHAESDAGSELPEYEPVEAAEADEYWGEPDEEWVEPEVLEIGQPEVPAEIEAAAMVSADLESDWTEESGVWPESEADGEGPVDGLAVPFPSPGSISAHGDPVTGAVWTVRAGASNPVVLDLAGVAASGQALELVIEPNADGRGVRLRIGAAASVEHEPASSDSPVLAAEPADEPVAGAPDAVEDAEASVDVPFLTGGLPVAESQDAAQDDPPVVDEPVAEEPQPIEVPVVPIEDPFDAIASGESDPVEVFIVDDSPLDEPVGVSASAPAPLEEDPAKILADIRARLAALDARRS